MTEPDQVLERAHWDGFWIPAVAKVVSRPELGFVHASFDSSALNTVVRTRAPARRLDTSITEVRRAHAGVRSTWEVPCTIDVPPLEAAQRVRTYPPACVVRIDVSRW